VQRTRLSLVESSPTPKIKAGHLMVLHCSSNRTLSSRPLKIYIVQRLALIKVRSGMKMLFLRSLSPPRIISLPNAPSKMSIPCQIMQPSSPRPNFDCNSKLLYHIALIIMSTSSPDFDSALDAPYSDFSRSPVAVDFQTLGHRASPRELEDRRVRLASLQTGPYVPLVAQGACRTPTGVGRSLGCDVPAGAGTM